MGLQQIRRLEHGVALKFDKESGKSCESAEKRSVSEM